MLLYIDKYRLKNPSLHSSDLTSVRAVIPLTTLFLLFFLLVNTTPLQATQSTIVLSELIDSQLLNKDGLSGAHILEKGEESLLARGWLAENAERTIDVQYFIWSTDNIGILAAEFLLRAAERGIRIRVIVDDLLIDAPETSMLALAAHPNIDIKIYNPKHSVGVSKMERWFHMLTDFRSFNQRMHDKTMIVDKLVGITGGRNMADEYYDYDHKYNFRDRDILVIGPVVLDMSDNFDEFWTSPLSVPLEKALYSDEETLAQSEIHEAYKELHSYAADPKNFIPEVRQAITNIPAKFPRLAETLVWDNIQFISDVPGKNPEAEGLTGGGDTTRQLIELMANAKKSITIQSPYLIMPEGGIEFFAALIKGGVQVQIVTNSLAATDNLQAFSGYAKQRDKILAAGIEVFEFKPRPEIRKELIERLEALERSVPIFALHAKTMIVDGEVLFVGSFNLDPRSANLNTEVGILINNEHLATEVEEVIKTDMRPENSWRAGNDNPDQHATLTKRLKIAFWKLFPLEPLL